MTNYKSAFGKVCRIKNRQYSKSMPILNSAYFTECRRHIVIPCGKVCRIKNRHTFRILPILNSAYFKSMPILNSSYHAVKYAELRIGSILKVCRFVIRHITQTETQTETEANFTHKILKTFFSQGNQGKTGFQPKSGEKFQIRKFFPKPFSNLLNPKM